MYMAIGNTYKIILFHLLMACRVEPEVKHDEEPPGHYSLLNTTPGSNPYCKLTIIICKWSEWAYLPSHLILGHCHLLHGSTLH